MLCFDQGGANHRLKDCCFGPCRKKLVQPSLRASLTPRELDSAVHVGSGARPRDGLLRHKSKQDEVPGAKIDNFGTHVVPDICPTALDGAGCIRVTP